MSLAALNWAFRYPEIDHVAKFVLVALADNFNDDECRAFPKTETLCAKTNLGRTAVFEALARLEDAGIIRRERRRRTDGSQRASAYVICDFEVNGTESAGRTEQGPPGGLDRVRRADGYKNLNPSKRTVPDNPSAPIIMGSSVATLPRAEEPAPSIITSEFDFISDDGSVHVTAEEFAELERRFPDVKNIRGLLRHACRSWLTDCPKKYKKDRFVTWLGNRQQNNVEKKSAPPKATKAERETDMQRLQRETDAARAEARVRREAYLERQRQREEERERNGQITH